VNDDLGQLLWIGFDGPRVPPHVETQLAAGAIGATVLFKRNLVTSLDTPHPSGLLRAPAEPGLSIVDGPVPQEVTDLDALVELNRALHRAAPDGTPSLVAVDQEGGLVQRVRAPATRWPPMLSHDGLVAPADAQIAEEVGRAVGLELRALGFDIDFAPVLDVHTNPANPIIGERAFGVEAEAAARRALAFARGLDEAGVLACGKHFPGHGDTSTDSHLELPRIDHGWDRLETVELLPFARAAKAKLPMIMTAHVVFAAIDSTRPATLSEAVVTGLLRGKLGYHGVVVSDDLDMNAIASHGGVGPAAVAAIRAGCDALLVCQRADHQAAAAESLAREAEASSEFRRRVGEAAARIRAMKQAHAANQQHRPAPPRDVIGSFEHRRLADRLAGRG
jgi:beta-N-acetylhexosaminidase